MRGEAMRTTHPVRQSRDPLPQQSGKDIPIVIVPRQTGEAIRRRRDIRETFHDSKAFTINGGVDNRHGDSRSRDWLGPAV